MTWRGGANQPETHQGSIRATGAIRMRFNMRVYTVHEPPPKRYENNGDPDRFVFVRDGFSFWAFLFGPLWMLRNRMWLVLLGYIGVVVVLEVAQYLLDVSSAVSFVVSLLLMFLVGFEAATMRRFTLGRRKWTNVGVIVGNNIEAAERRFFDAWAMSGGATTALAAVLSPHQPSAAATDVIGLFPQPGPRR
jgi:hypothetical protein